MFVLAAIKSSALKQNLRKKKKQLVRVQSPIAYSFLLILPYLSRSTTN